ncbi:MAG: 6-phosphogluconolactonase [Ignavibacteriales bacterium]|nr:6-phosphogluconolactonase [Ignavibacteriales bacterium]
MVKIFENIDKLTASLFEEIASSLKNNNKINIALSGGSTPYVIFQLLAKNYNNKIEWNKIHFFWVDERCVSVDSSDSNYGMTKKALLNHIQISNENVHPVYCDKDYQEAVQKYSADVKSIVPIINNLPRFDLVLLGVGSDGHTASIFYDQIHLMKSYEICSLSVHPESKQKRITLTGRVINNSKKIIFIVTGKNKAVVVSNILNKQHELRLPAEYIKPTDGTLDWFLDREASSLL